MATRKEIIEKAQEKLDDVIRMLKFACDGDPSAESYIIDHLLILQSRNHGFLDSSLNLDDLIERYENDHEDIGWDEFFEDEDE